VECTSWHGCSAIISESVTKSVTSNYYCVFDYVCTFATFFCSPENTSSIDIWVCTHPTHIQGPCKFLSHFVTRQQCLVRQVTGGDLGICSVIGLHAHDQYQSKDLKLMFTSITAQSQALPMSTSSVGGHQ